MVDRTTKPPSRDGQRPAARRPPAVRWKALTLVGITGGLGLAAGAAVAVWQASDVAAGDQGPRIGHWTFPSQAGDPAASPVDRARMATTGTLALSASEAIYFVTARDRDDAPLDPDCLYTVTIIEPPDARWWSLAVYNEDNRYILGETPRASLTSRHVPRDGEEVRMTIGPDETGSAGIPTRGARAITLLFRVYNPAQAWRDRLPDVALPVVEKIRC